MASERTCAPGRSDLSLASLMLTLARSSPCPARHGLLPAVGFQTLLHNFLDIPGSVSRGQVVPVACGQKDRDSNAGEHHSRRAGAWSGGRSQAALLASVSPGPGPHCRSPPRVREHGPLPRKAAARAGACVPPLAEPPFRRPHEPRPASNTHTFVGCLARGLVRPGSILALPQGVSFPRIPGLQARARGCERRRARVARAFSLSEPEGPGPAW